MISYLVGQPIVEKDSITLLVGGVGYGVHVISSLLSKASNLEELKLFIYTHVKEDRLDLYGFENRQQKDLFLLLISVSGVGPSTALQITDQSPSAIIDAVQQANTAFFSAVPRVGKKLAQKIIIELSGKLGQLKSLDLGPESTNRIEVREALMSLGFDENSIETVLQQIELEEQTVEASIKQSLKLLAK